MESLGREGPGMWGWNLGHPPCPTTHQWAQGWGRVTAE